MTFVLVGDVSTLIFNKSQSLTSLPSKRTNRPLKVRSTLAPMNKNNALFPIALEVSNNLIVPLICMMDCDNIRTSVWIFHLIFIGVIMMGYEQSYCVSKDDHHGVFTVLL